MPFHHASNGSGGAAGEFDNFSCQDIHWMMPRQVFAQVGSSSEPIRIRYGSLNCPVAKSVISHHALGFYVYPELRRIVLFSWLLYH